MRKLSLYAIKQLHDMARAGVPKTTIASRLGVHRHTVRSHVDGMVTYPHKLIDRLGLHVMLKETEPLSLYDASFWLPGQPSRSLMHDYLRRGMLESTILGNIRSRRALHVVTFQQMRKFCGTYWPLPEGLYVPAVEAHHYARAENWTPLPEHVDKRGLFPVIPLPVLMTELQPSIGSVLLRRGMKCLEKLGIGVL